MAGDGESCIADVRFHVCDTGHGRTFLFVVVETEGGVLGVGEGSQSDQDGAVVANLDLLRDRYLGADVFEVIERFGTLLRSNRAGRAVAVAVSALEIACWDAIGKHVGVPVYRLLGGAAHDSLRCYATLAAGLTDWSPDGLAAEAARCVECGMTAVKVAPFLRLGAKPVAHGFERVKAVREAVGAEVAVLVECQFAFDRADAVGVARALEGLDCFWLEAPLRWDDPVELAAIRRSLPIRVASGETMHGRLAYRELIEQRAVDVVQPDVKWTGGILEAKKIAAWAEAYQLAVSLHNNSGPVGTAASAHLSLTLPNALLVETPSRQPPWEDDLTSARAVVAGGRVAQAVLRERPGLGIDFDEGVARAQAVR